MYEKRRKNIGRAQGETWGDEEKAIFFFFALVEKKDKEVDIEEKEK